MATNETLWQCRLCLARVPRNNAISLISKNGKKQNWTRRIGHLLSVHMEDDQLTQHVCSKCCRRIERLEKCAMDLESFKAQASESYNTLRNRSHKRPKETSAVDVTPDTARERPPAKRAVGMRKRLDFGQASLSVSIDSSQELCGEIHLSVADEAATVNETQLDTCEPSEAMADHALHICDELNLSVAEAATVNETQIDTCELSEAMADHALHICDELHLSVAEATVNETQLSHASSTEAPQQSSSPVKKAVTVIVSTPSRPDHWTRQLNDDEAMIGRALAGGNVDAVAKAVMGHSGLHNTIHQLVLNEIENECTTLCKRSVSSPFRKMALHELMNIQWEQLISNLRTQALLIFQILTKIVSMNDHRNKQKAGAAHYPGICMAMAVMLKEKNREMCGIQSLVSLLLFQSHVEKKVYSRLNHLNLSLSYTATLQLIGRVSKLHKNPIQQWIQDGVTFKFIGDNVDKHQRVRDVRSDNQGKMLHMYSVLVARSRLPSSGLSHSGNVADLMALPWESFLPSSNDIEKVKSNLVSLVSRFLTTYIKCLVPFSKSVPKHITHKYSKEMCKKSEIAVLDCLMKNEACGPEMIDIMQSMQAFLGSNYPSERKVLSGGDQLTCERQAASQRHMMDGKTADATLQLLEPQLEDWHTLVCTLTAAWKCLYSSKNHSSRDHGTLGYFKSRLNRTTVPSKPKKEVNASLEFFLTVVKGHLVAAACDVLGISSPDSPIELPQGILKGTSDQQLSFVTSVSTEVVNRCSLIGTEWIKKAQDSKTGDGVYNYARVLCHFGSIVLEFYDAWSEGDGDRIHRCYRLLMPHFISYGHTKYALQALRLQFQVSAYLSPHLAHHILWDRFVNTRGRMGANLPCDLHNEHVNKLIKEILSNMGSNLTEEALQRAARSVTALQTICQSFDTQSGVPIGTSSHFTRSDAEDVAKVALVVRERKLLYPISGRNHSSFPNFSLDPLKSWNRDKTHKWIEQKKKLFTHYQGRGGDESDDSTDSDDED